MIALEISDILEAIDILEYISQYCDFEEKGGEFWCLSPFKDEKTPSFSVDPEQQVFYDFSSGSGGNIINFIQQYHSVSLPQAIEMAKQYAGLADDDKSTVLSAKMTSARIARKFKKPLTKEISPAREILPEDCMEKYEFRKDKLQLWADEGITFDTMLRFNVRYDAFSNRIVHPIRDFSGNIINICGRTCDPDFKQKKIRKYTYFNSFGLLNTLYGYAENKDSIISSKEIILFEGAKSVMKAYGWGYTNCAALLTSHLSRQQFLFLVRLCSWYSVRIVFALDADVDVSADKHVRLLTRYADVSVVKNFDDLLDPKDAPVDKGEDVWRSLYDMKQKL